MKTITLIQRRIVKAEKKYDTNLKILKSMLFEGKPCGFLYSDYYMALGRMIEAQQEIKTLKWVLEEAI
jgi:hypothetical protein